MPYFSPFVRKSKFTWLIYLLLLSGCVEEDKILDQDTIDEQLIQNYITEKGISPTKHETGFYYEVIQSNSSGQPLDINNVALVHYKISLLNGKVLESRQSNPLKFIHAWGGLVPEAINNGVGLMKTGEKYRFIIPSRIGLGSFYAVGYIGPNEVLIAEIELVGKETLGDQRISEDQLIKDYLANLNITNFFNYSSGVYKYTVSPGMGPSPTGGSLVRLQITRKYLDETVIRSSPSDTLYIPYNSTDSYLGVTQPTLGLKEGLLNMNLGETASIIVPSHLAFGGVLLPFKDVNEQVKYNGSVQIIPQKFRNEFVENVLKMQNIYPLSPIKYEIKILEIKKVK